MTSPPTSSENLMLPRFCTHCGSELKEITTPSWMRRRFSPTTGQMEEWVGEVMLDCPQGRSDALLGYESGHSVAIILKPGAWSPSS